MASYFSLIWALLLLAAVADLIVSVLMVTVPQYRKKLDKAHALPGDYFIPGFEKESLAMSNFMRNMQLHTTRLPKDPLIKKNRQRRTGKKLY